MADAFDRDDHEGGGSGFMMGLLTGTVLGAGLGMLLAPKSGSELRNQLGEQASSLKRVTGEQFRRASDAATGIADKARQTVGRATEEARQSVGRATEEARQGVGHAAEEIRAKTDEIA
jgi:gas vesicle protein